MMVGVTYGGMTVQIVDAQDQRRTRRDVPGAWLRPKVPSKRRGRKGTRRQFKRAHPPGRSWLYREPTDVLVIHGKTMIVTPQQANELRRRSQSLGGYS